MNSALKGRIGLRTVLRPFWHKFDMNFEFWICRCTPFEETRLVTSSAAQKHVTEYNTFNQSNTSNVNLCQFQDWNKLIVTRCKRNVLKLC